MAQKLQSYASRQLSLRTTGRWRSFEGKRYDMVDGGYFQAADGAWLHRDAYRHFYAREIPPGWHVHHVNCRPWDNRKKNLVALPPIVHDYVHFLMASYTHAARVPRKDCALWASQWKNGTLVLDGRDWTKMPVPYCMKLQPKQVAKYAHRIPNFDERKHVRA